jgi:hypothetical protein
MALNCPKGDRIREVFRGIDSSTISDSRRQFCERIPMTRVLTAIAMSVVVFVPAHALADTFSQSTVSKRQMMVQVIKCMRKRMSADKVISYNAAAKLCETQVNDLGNNSVTFAKEASAPAKP